MNKVNLNEIKIPSFNKARILVVGDIFLDRYWFGNTQRISPEAPVPVVHLNTCEERPGGAGNVAVNLAALGVETILLGAVGKDNDAKILLKKLREKNIDVVLQEVNGAPTITKTRILSQQQQLIRLDLEEYFYQINTTHLEQEFSRLISNCDAVILSNYLKGTVQNPQFFIQLAEKKGIPILVDPKNKDFSVYRGADVLTPNRKEFEAALGSCASLAELETKGQEALSTYQWGSLLITRGSEGMTLLQANEAGMHLPARAYEVRDVTGAGDTVISILAAALAAGESIFAATQLANMAAGIVVTKLGTAAITPFELRHTLQKQNSQVAILTPEEALLMREEARQRGEKVVMTNGCFDILHPGHIAYLEEARALGNLLFIAVNDDASVVRLKGPGRPVQKLEDRMRVLAGLRCVDGVIAFSEDTPENLITKISPDILVKGIDYQGAEIAGAEHVLSQGGEVKRIGPEKQWSSTDIIEKTKSLV